MALSLTCLQMTFWQQWELGNIKRIELPKKKIKFKLLIPYHQISGNKDLKEVPCLISLAFDRLEKSSKENGAMSLNQLSVKKNRQSYLADTNL